MISLFQRLRTLQILKQVQDDTGGSLSDEMLNCYYIWFLLSQQDSNFYTGYTSQLKQRMSQHQKGEVPSTKHRRPLTLIYFEGCRNEGDARAREKYLKSGMGKRYLRNRIKRSLRANF